MSIGYRLLVLGALGLAVFTALGTGAYFGALYSPSDKQYRTISTGEGTFGPYRGVTESLPDAAGVPDPIERAIANPQSYGGEDKEERDLAAQESMAVWAFWMASAAFGTMFVTIFGTILIWKQVSLTRKAVEDTGDATDAMIHQSELAGEANRLNKEALAHAKAAALDGSRPWIMYDGFDTLNARNSMLDGVRYDKLIGFQPAFKNFSSTPAIKCRMFTQHRVMNWDSPPPEFPDLIDQALKHQIFAPGRREHVPPRFVVGQELAMLYDRQQELWVHVINEYYDPRAPDEARYTETCLCIRFQGKREIEGRIQDGWEAMIEGPQNRAI